MEERRVHFRLPMPQLTVSADGAFFSTIEWSQGNMVIDAAQRYRVGALVSIDALGFDKGSLQRVGIRGRVTRVTEIGAAAVDFLHRDDAAMLTLRALAGD